MRVSRLAPTIYNAGAAVKAQILHKSAPAPRTDAMTDRRHQITRAALAVFARYGLRRASMQDVAEEAGLSRPALYQYFRNKDDLVAACVDQVTADGFAQSEAACEGVTGATNRTRAYLVAHMKFYHQMLFSGPHSDEVMEIKTRFGKDKIPAARSFLAERLNDLAGLDIDDETGTLLANAAEGLKLEAPDTTTLERQVSRLVTAILTSEPS